MKLIKKLNTIFDHTLNLTAVLSGIMLVFALVSVTVGIAARYFLNLPIGWISEIAGYILLHVAFLAAAWILKSEGHVKMDLILERVTTKARAVLNIITSLISAGVCFILTWFGVNVAVDLYKTKYFTTTMLELPKFLLVAVIFIGSFLLLIQFLRRAFGYVESLSASPDKEVET